MLKWLVKSLLILIALVVASAILPVASFWLCSDPLGSNLLLGCAVDLRVLDAPRLSAHRLTVLARRGSRKGMEGGAGRVRVQRRQIDRVDVLWLVRLLRRRVCRRPAAPSVPTYPRTIAARHVQSGDLCRRVVQSWVRSHRSARPEGSRLSLSAKYCGCT